MNGDDTAIAGADLWTWRQRAIAEAQSHHIDVSEVDWLIRALCNVDTLALRLGTLTSQAEIASQVTLQELATLWTRRVRNRVPLQHLVGRTPWRDFTLHVSPKVLIPRPETELIIDIVASLVEQYPAGAELKQGIWADLGTGSGAIALGLATQLPQAQVIAVDISEAALAIAQKNAVAHGLGDRIQFRQGSWFEPLTPELGQFAGIVANPPYIPAAIVPTLAPEVAQHEPRVALDGGADGLAAVRHLVQQAPDFLRSGGLWLVELMAGQATDVVSLLTAQDFVQSQVWADLAQIQRFVSAVRR